MPLTLLERMSTVPNDAWGPEADAAADAFKPLPRRLKRPREVELDPEYLFTPWLDDIAVQADGSKAQRCACPKYSHVPSNEYYELI